MNLQVQPLKVLATREVVMNRLDYSTYLNGATKVELDRLDKLEGNFRIHSSKLTIDAFVYGERLPSDDWEYFKAYTGRYGIPIPRCVVRLIEELTELTKEFSITESKNGPRTWILSVGFLDRYLLTEKGHLKETMEGGLWTFEDDFIEDGRLVGVKQWHEVYNGKYGLVANFSDSITTDKQGNIVWSFMYNLPKKNIKFTKTMWAHRVIDGHLVREAPF